MNCWLLAAFFLVLLWFVLHFVPLCPITKHGVWPTLSTTPWLFFLISCHCFNFQNSKLSGRKKIHSILLGYTKFPTNFSDFLTILTNWLFAFFSWVQNPDSRSFKVYLWISFKNQSKTHFVFSQSFSSLLKTHKKGKFEGCCSVWQIWKATGGVSLSGRLLLLMLCAITLTTEKGAVVTQRLRAGFTKFKKFT